MDSIYHLDIIILLLLKCVNNLVNYLFIIEEYYILLKRKLNKDWQTCDVVS